MRLLLVNYEFPPIGGGAGNATAGIAGELASLGHRVDVLTSAFRGVPNRHDNGAYAVRRIPVIRRHADRCSKFEMLTFLLSSCAWIFRIPKADCAIAFFTIPSGPSCWWLKMLRRTPYIVSLRGGDVPGFQPYDLAATHRITAPAIRFLWRHAHRVVANSNGLAGLARTAAPKQSVEIVPNGVDTARFFPSPELRSGHSAPQLLFTGRLVRQKGVDILLHALSLLPSELAWTLRLVGDGPERTNLETRARNLNLANRIQFHGWAQREQLPQLYRDADLFVFPSRDEGMPNAMLEAMASGLGVVATRIAGNEDLVQPGLNGLLVPPDDGESFARALEEALRPPARLSAFGARSREIVEAGYSWNKVATAYAALCAQAAKCAPLEERLQ